MEKIEKVVVTLEYMFKELEGLQDLHIQMGREMLEADNGNLFHFDFFAYGIFHRSLMLISGFMKLIPDNFISAAPMVRMQLDNFLRTSAVHRVDMKVHEFAIAVIGGKAIKDFQDKDSKKKLTDATLVSIAEKQYPGISAFYKKASGYIHFSDTHIFHTVSADTQTGIISGSISKEETRVPDRLRIEACISMYEITKIVLSELNGWIFTKSNSELVAEWRKK